MLRLLHLPYILRLMLCLLRLQLCLPQCMLCLLRLKPASLGLLNPSGD